MPEGPEIRRAADRLEEAVVDKPLTDVWFAFPRLQPYQPALIGQRVKGIETRGKALLTHFTNSLTLYSHNQLYGIWRVFKHDDAIDHGKRSLRVKIATPDSAILLYSASEIEIWPTEEVYQHPFLQRIGPDVLDEKLTVEQVRVRLVSKRFTIANWAACCSIRRFSPDWVTICARRSSGWQGCCPRIARRISTTAGWICWPMPACPSLATPTPCVERWMRTSTTAQCFALRFSPERVNRASAAVKPL